MMYELWYSESTSSALFLPEGDRSWAPLKASDAAVLWTVEGASYREALQKCSEFCKRSGFLPTPSGVTMRVVCVAYTDGTGLHKVEFPSWGSVLPQLGHYLGELDGFDVLGQVLVERPLAEMPDEMTVVELESVDGKDRMVQEFAGHIPSQAEAVGLVAQRLGPQFEGWRLKEAVFYTRRR